MNDKCDFHASSLHLEKLGSDLHTLGALVAGNFAPGAVSINQWPIIADLALRHGLGPMLHWTLKQAKCDIETNPAWAPLVRSRYQSAIDWALKERAQLKVDAALVTAGIPALWLKGSVLARSVYPEPSLRPMGDLDVLVPYEQREAALDIVRKAGFDFFTIEGVMDRSSAVRSFTHHYLLRGEIRNTVELELHFRLLGHHVPRLDQLQWFLGYQQSVQIADGVLLYTLTPEAHLVYLAAHAMLQHGEEQLYLLRYFDLHQLITQSPPAWEIVLDMAVTMEWTFVLERALFHAVEYYSTPVPPEVFEQLICRRPSQENTRRVTHRRGLLFHFKRFCAKFSYLPITEKLRLLFRIIFPTPAFMRRQYLIQAGHSVLPYYFVRWYNRGRIWAGAVWARAVK